MKGKFWILWNSTKERHKNVFFGQSEFWVFLRHGSIFRQVKWNKVVGQSFSCGHFKPLCVHVGSKTTIGAIVHADMVQFQLILVTFLRHKVEHFTKLQFEFRLNFGFERFCVFLIK